MQRLSKILTVVALLALLATVLCAILGFQRPFAAYDWEKLALTSFATCLHALFAVGMLTALARGKLRRLMVLGLLMDAAAWNGVLVAIWADMPQPLANASLTALGWSLLLMVAGLSRCQPANGTLARRVQAATMFLLALIAMAWPAWLLLFDTSLRRAEPVGRLIGVMAILAVAGLLTNLVLARRGASAEDERPVADRRRVTVWCPRCDTEQPLLLNGAACARCGLHIKVQVP